MKRFFVFLILAILILVVYFTFFKNQPENFVTIDNQPAKAIQTTSYTISEKYKTFIFDKWHGSTEISDKFKFQYPADWHNEGQYFSPQKIQFYTKYEAKAPIWFDLVLTDIFEYTELKYKIDNSQRRSPDTIGKIDDKEFKRYDLIDYGTYGGENAGHVKIFIGPTIKIDNTNYILVFYWEERPLAEYMPGNDISVFDNMLLTLKFF